MTAPRPEDLGFDSTRLDRIGTMTHRYVDAGKLPGVQTLVSRRGEIVYHDVYGHADVERGTPLADDTIFRIYSMAKPITSVALMMLYEDGEVLLENPVSRWIPEFAGVSVWGSGTVDDYTTVDPEREITVHDVLTHLSGLTAGFQYSHPVDALYRDAGLGDLVRPDCDLEEAMSRLAALPLLCSPGTGWNYGMSTDVCGRIVEVVSGQTLDEFFREQIFEPLGMVDTGFYVPGDRVGRFCANYTRGRDGTLREIDAVESSAYLEPPVYLSGAGGLVSTAADYHRFCRMLLGGGEVDGVRMLGRKTVGYMTRNHLPGGQTLNDLGQSTFSETAMEGVGFGLGFSIVLDAAVNQSMTSEGEYAWGGAASTAFWVDPVEEIICVFMTQLLPSNTYPIRRQLRAAVYQALVD